MGAVGRDVQGGYQGEGEPGGEIQGLESTVSPASFSRARLGAPGHRWTRPPAAQWSPPPTHTSWVKQTQSIPGACRSKSHQNRGTLQEGSREKPSPDRRDAIRTEAHRGANPIPPGERGRTQRAGRASSRSAGFPPNSQEQILGPFISLCPRGRLGCGTGRWVSICPGALSGAQEGLCALY